jgi:hypothetical protein
MVRQCIRTIAQSCLWLFVLSCLLLVAPVLAQTPPTGPTQPSDSAAGGDPASLLNSALQSMAEVQNILTGNLNGLSREQAQDASRRLAAANQSVSKVNGEELDYSKQTNALFILLGLTGVFVLVSAVGILLLTKHVRQVFWTPAAAGNDNIWRTYLMQLPLGAPEGSIRALISMYVIVFGLLVLVMQKRLGVTSSEAITGFIGVVITFYFTSRSNDQAQKVTEAAKAATDSATQAISSATQQVQDAHAALTSATGAVKTLGTAPGAADATDAASTGRLRDISDKMQVARQAIGALKSLNVGTGLLTNADGLIGDADNVLGVIQTVLNGKPDAKTIGDAINQAQPLLDKLSNAGLPSVFGEVISAIGPASRLLGPALAGIPGGPIGIVGGLVMGGLQLMDDQRKFEAWKSALLAKPFDRSLLPPVVDGNVALLVLQFAPLMRQRLANAPPALATELLRAVVPSDPDEEPVSTTDLATQLFARPDLQGLFASPAELAQALEEYRGSAIFAQASKSLTGQINIPSLGPGTQATSVDLPTLMRSALQMRADPRAAAALDQIAYVVQALGALHLGPDKLMSLVQSALQLGASLAGSHQSEEPRQ